MNKKSVCQLISTIFALGFIALPIYSQNQSQAKKNHQHQDMMQSKPIPPQASPTNSPAMQTKPMPTQEPAIKSSTQVTVNAQPATSVPPAQPPVTTGGGLMAPPHAMPVAVIAPGQDPIQNMSEQVGKIAATYKQQRDDISKLDSASLKKKKTDLMQEHVNKANDLDLAYAELKRLSQTQDDVIKNADAIHVQLNRIVLDASQIASINSLMK